MLVVDTSAVVDALAAAEPLPDLVRRLESGGEWHAPHALDVEVHHALRGLVQGNKLTPERANDARVDFNALTVARYPISGLSDRIWELRHTLTAYDAAYVALAEILDCPLVTCDAKLARASHRATVEVYNPL